MDLFGRVVGVNSAIAAGPRFIGYGFAVPIDLAERVVSDLREYGYVRRPRLGITVADVSAVDAEVYKLDRIAGAQVKSVADNSPASRAGLRPGDVVVTSPSCSARSSARPGHPPRPVSARARVRGLDSMWHR